MIENDPADAHSDETRSRIDVYLIVSQHFLIDQMHTPDRIKLWNMRLFAAMSRAGCRLDQIQVGFLCNNHRIIDLPFKTECMGSDVNGFQSGIDNRYRKDGAPKRNADTKAYGQIAKKQNSRRPAIASVQTVKVLIIHMQGAFVDL